MVVVDLQRMKRVLWMLVKLFSYSSCNIIIDAAKAHITDQNIKVLEFYIICSSCRPEYRYTRGVNKHVKSISLIQRVIITQLELNASA